jgi:hypothetical protein
MSGIFGDDEGTLGSQFVSEENSFVAQLGRISGKALQPNLVRNGADLTFRNNAGDPDLLYLSVDNNRIGIEGKRTLPETLERASGSAPLHAIDVNDNIRSNDVVTINTIIANITVNNSTFSTTVGAINVVPTQNNPVIIHDRLITSDLEFNDNYIGSLVDSNMLLDTNGTGTVELQSSTNIYADLDVTGNINLSGNLSKLGNLIIGNAITDIVIINTDFTQNIVLGTDNLFDLGKSNKKWNNLFTPDLTNVDLLLPSTAIISTQLLIDGNSNNIFSIQSNEDVELLPDTGIVYIEQTKWQTNDITNLLDTPLTFSSTGIGYTRFMGNNGFVIPAGTDLERRASPEIGETRWNTDQGYLECYDGSVWAVSTGGGIEVDVEIMEDLGHAYTLMLG